MKTSEKAINHSNLSPSDAPAYKKNYARFNESYMLRKLQQVIRGTYILTHVSPKHTELRMLLSRKHACTMCMCPCVVLSILRTCSWSARIYLMRIAHRYLNHIDVYIQQEASHQMGGHTLKELSL